MLIRFWPILYFQVTNIGKPGPGPNADIMPQKIETNPATGETEFTCENFTLTLPEALTDIQVTCNAKTYRNEGAEPGPDLLAMTISPDTLRESLEVAKKTGHLRDATSLFQMQLKQYQMRRADVSVWDDTSTYTEAKLHLLLKDYKLKNLNANGTLYFFDDVYGQGFQYGKPDTDKCVTIEKYFEQPLAGITLQLCNRDSDKALGIDQSVVSQLVAGVKVNS